MQPANPIVIDGTTTIAGEGGVGFPGAGGGSGYDDRVVTLIDSYVVENQIFFPSIDLFRVTNGFANINYIGRTRVDNTVTRNTVVSGSRTNALTLSANVVGVQTVSCTVTSSVATNTPVVSNSTTFVVKEESDPLDANILIVEGITIFNELSKSVIEAVSGKDYVFDSLNTNTSESRNIKLYSIYSPDKDLDVEMELHGGSGGGSNPGVGGYSKIRFTIERNVEYVISGIRNSFSPRISSQVNTPFVYRKGTLIACVGGGGDSGFRDFFSSIPAEKGGDGGGIGVSGESTNTANGGQAIPAGTLPSDGIFGSRDLIKDSSGKLIFLSRFPDTQSDRPFGGRTIPCPRGEYWREQGFAPCADLGNVPFRTADGTIVEGTTDDIVRGYKDGYNIQETAGGPNFVTSNSGDTLSTFFLGGSTTEDGGGGGCGATGGDAGSGGGAGAGGSGYTDGSVTVVETQLGGSQYTIATVILRLAP